MGNRKHFQAWLRLARSLDWSFEHRDTTCVRAFTALQLAMQKCGRGKEAACGESATAAAGKSDLNGAGTHWAS